MRDAHGRIGGVDVLAAGARGPHRIDADVFVANLDVDVLDFGQHGDGGGGRVDAALRFGGRDTLHAVPAGLVFQPRIGALAGVLGDDFFIPAGVAVALLHDLNLPALQVGVALVHAQQVASEQRRLVAAG